MLEIGTMLSGRYEVLKRVGSGGMADVYMAKDHKLNRNVAVKVLKSEYVEDEKFLKKFETEAQAVARLSHPNIVNVYDVGIEDGINYIVMELAEGMTLKEYIRRKGYLSPKETVEISLQIASAISHAHKNHIIHRDIKPQNILVSEIGNERSQTLELRRQQAAIPLHQQQQRWDLCITFLQNRQKEDSVMKKVIFIL